jgi:hypothetical protein
LRFRRNVKLPIFTNRFFFILEDLESDGIKIPEDRHQKIRKRILDLGNDTIRELEDYFDKFIEYNNNNKK